GILLKPALATFQLPQAPLRGSGANLLECLSAIGVSHPLSFHLFPAERFTVRIGCQQVANRYNCPLTTTRSVSPCWCANNVRWRSPHTNGMDCRPSNVQIETDDPFRLYDKIRSSYATAPWG